MYYFDADAAPTISQKTCGGWPMNPLLVTSL